MTKKVIGFHYTLKTTGGDLIDSSEGQEPLLFLQDSGMIIPGLEKELVQMNVGDNKNVQVKAADAYGEVINDLVISVKKSQFPPEADLKVGDQFQVNEEPDAPVFTVVDIQDEDITLDGNHPLAGIDLSFDVEITEVREATEEEISHGHAHGVGGHNH